jgi:Na+/melibiose symporter-like transporter
VVCLIPLLVVAEQGRSWGWGSGRSLGCYVIGVLGLVAYIFAERAMGDAALIPLRFYKNSVFSLSSIVAVVVGMGMFGGISVLPLYLQIVRGVSPTESGLLLLPLTAGLMLGSIVSGQLISRTGKYKKFPIIGAALLTVALLLMHFIGADTPLWQTDIYGGIFGIGIGNLMQPITLATQNAMPPRDIGVATSSSTFFRQMGGTLGVAVFLSILFSTVGGNIGSAYQKAGNTAAFQSVIQNQSVQSDPDNKQLLALLHSNGSVSSSTLNDTSFLKHSNKTLAHPFFVGFSKSMDLVFIIAAVITLIGFVLVLFLKELPLRTMSGIDAQRAAQAESL